MYRVWYTFKVYKGFIKYLCYKNIGNTERKIDQVRKELSKVKNEML